MRHVVKARRMLQELEAGRLGAGDAIEGVLVPGLTWAAEAVTPLLSPEDRGRLAVEVQSTRAYTKEQRHVLLEHLKRAGMATPPPRDAGWLLRLSTTGVGSSLWFRIKTLERTGRARAVQALHQAGLAEVIGESETAAWVLSARPVDGADAVGLYVRPWRVKDRPDGPCTQFLIEIHPRHYRPLLGDWMLDRSLPSTAAEAARWVLRAAEALLADPGLDRVWVQDQGDVGLDPTCGVSGSVCVRRRLAALAGVTDMVEAPYRSVCRGPTGARFVEEEA